MMKLSGVLWMGVALAVMLPGSVRGQEAIDMNRARVLNQRDRRGEALTAEERAYLDSAKAVRADQGRGQVAAPARESTGVVPLTDLTGTYKGQSGGLYGGGKNEPPAEQLARSLAAAGEVVPLDGTGKASPAGTIVLASIGMSNTTQEFSVFKRLADGDAAKNPKLVIVDGAQGAMDAAAWANGPGADAVWNVMKQRLQSAGVTPAQVQVVWIKQALAQAGTQGDFPKHAEVLQADLVKALGRAKKEFPNLRLAYLSSRTYGGYATGTLNPEPYAYEGAFAVRGVIEAQMKGAAAMNSDAAKGPVVAPVILWGPYLWADGMKGRKGDALVWKREDFGPDGTHPSTAGREKVARLLLDFLKTNQSAKGWFAAEAG